MTEQKKPTPAQKLKAAEKEIAQLKELVFQLTDQLETEYEKGKQEGIALQTQIMEHTFQAQQAIQPTRWKFRKG